MTCLAFIVSLLVAAPRFIHYNAADGLPSNTVYAVTQDAEGALWIGTRNGLARYDGAHFQSWKEYGRVNALTVDKAGRLWVGTTQGLRVRDDDIAGNIRALHTDTEGFVWATVGDTLLLKLSYRDGIREEARCPYRKRDSEGDYPYYQIYEAQDGKLWLAGRLVQNQFVEDRQDPHSTLASWDGVLCIGSYAEAGGKLYAFEDHTSILYSCNGSQPIPLGRLPIAHARLLTDHTGRLWAAGSYGAGPVDTEKPADTPVYKTPSTELYCLFEDRQGNLWLGGDNGLSVLSPALRQVEILSRDNVTALLEDHTGKMWIGKADDRVSSLYEDREGTVYVGLWNSTGWEVWKGGRKAYKDRLTGPLPEEQVEARYLDGANWISDFLEDSEGRFWVVTWEGVGLNEWDRKARKSFPPRWLSPFRYPSAQNDSVIYLSSRLGSRLIEDARGNLVYATTEAGLNVIDRETGLVTKYYRGNSSIPDDYVTDLCLSPDGAIWAATRSGLWSPSGAHFLDGMLVQSVEADARGRLWAGTEDGLYFIDTDGTTGRVPKELGFPSDIYGEHVSCRRAGGALAFGGSAGAVSFHPDSLLAIRAQGNLPLEKLIRHRYRLNEGEWTEERFAGLPDNISPGRYTLEEQSSDIFGRWEHGSTAVRSIRIPPPLWLRWPFLLGYLLIMMAAVYLVIKLRERRLLEKELDMRNRLFSIISHDLRNPVSGGAFLSRQLLENLDRLSPEDLREGLAQLSQSAQGTSLLLENLLLWSLNQKGMLAPVMRSEDLTALVEEALGALPKGSLVAVDIPAGLTVKTDRNMLLTVLRNLLDNALKVSSKVELHARGTTLRITDEGPGLQEGKKQFGHGMGLVITRELLDKMGATLNMKNQPQGGLEITIDL
jgi:ligand-binding sensor domain-containing protein/signal transduction histidine kinase